MIKCDIILAALAGSASYKEKHLSFYDMIAIGFICICLFVIMPNFAIPVSLFMYSTKSSFCTKPIILRFHTKAERKSFSQPAERCSRAENNNKGKGFYPNNNNNNNNKGKGGFYGSFGL